MLTSKTSELLPLLDHNHHVLLLIVDQWEPICFLASSFLVRSELKEALCHRSKSKIFNAVLPWVFNDGGLGKSSCTACVNEQEGVLEIDGVKDWLGHWIGRWVGKGLVQVDSLGGKLKYCKYGHYFHFRIWPQCIREQIIPSKVKNKTWVSVVDSCFGCILSTR